MKTRKELEKIQSDMINQIEDLMNDAASKNDEDEAMMQIVSFTGKLAMINFVLDETGAPFQVIEDATIHAFEKVVANMAIQGLKDLLVNS